MSQAGELDVVANHPQIPTMFVENVGIAIPAANTLDVLGAGSVLTTGAGNVITISVSGVAETFTVDASTPPGTNPVVPTAGNDITVHGTSVAAHSIPVQTDSIAANSYQVEVQLTSAQASSSVTHAGLASFNSADFIVDANGFVSVMGLAAWLVISASQTMSTNMGYICGAGGTLALLLPPTSNVGDIIEVTLDGSAGFTITQGAGQSIKIGGSVTTTGAGGSISSTAQGDSLRMVCRTANLRWICLSSMGNPTIV